VSSVSVIHSNCWGGSRTGIRSYSKLNGRRNRFVRDVHRRGGFEERLSCSSVNGEPTDGSDASLLQSLGDVDPSSSSGAGVHSTRRLNATWGNARCGKALIPIVPSEVSSCQNDIECPTSKGSEKMNSALKIECGIVLRTVAAR
jgi:hypothetical protein